MTKASVLAQENARLFLAGEELKPNKMHSEVTQFDVFTEILKCNRWPLLRSQEHEISDFCRVPSTLITLLAKTLFEDGFKPAVCNAAISVPLKVPRVLTH